MKLIIEAICSIESESKKFDGLDCQENFSEYKDERVPDCISGGYMSFIWKEDKLYTITEYETTRKLTEEEEKTLIDYTQGQWSDGIGEGFEQQEFSDGGYNPSPWYPGQIATILYE